MSFTSLAPSKIRAILICLFVSLCGAQESETAEAAGAAKQNPWVADEQTMFAFELIVMGFFIAFLLIFTLGSRANNSLARSIATTLEDCLKMQFAQIGTAEGKKLIRDGQSFFWFYATGRRYTSGLTVLMDLAKRMDVFSYTSSFLTAPQKDRVVFYLPITAEVDMEPMSLFLVTRKELKRLRDFNEGEAVKQVELFAGQAVGLEGLPTEFVAMTEHADIATALLPDSIRAVILENAKFVNSIHVTESGANWDSQSRPYKRLIRLDFTLPAKRSMIPTVIEGMSKVAMHLVDAAAEKRLSPAARKKALDLRKRAAQEVERVAQKKRAEEAAARRQEKKKEEEEAVGKMSREKQMKYEEKKRKKELSARLRKATRK